jgi:hypothetical protein
MSQQGTSMREHLALDRLYRIPNCIRIQRLLENSIALPLILRIADLFLLQPEHCVSSDEKLTAYTAEDALQA